jgi:hypothetical protein
VLTPLKRISVIVAVIALAGLGAGSALAAPTLRGASQSRTTSTTSSLAISRPAGTLPGDVLVAAIDANLYLATSITKPAGWYLIRREGTALGTKVALSQSLYYHVAGVLEPTSYTWRFGKKTGAAGAVLAYGGVSTGAPIADHSGRVQSNVTSIVAPEVVTLTGGTTLLGFFGTTGTRRVTPPADMTERHDISSMGSNLTSSEGADADLAAAGVSGARRSTVASSATRAVGQLVALNPLNTEPPAPPPPPPPAPPPPPVPPPPPPPPPADTDPPETALSSGPAARTSSTSAQFQFSADEAGSTFECALDAAPFTPCVSPLASSGLASGSHSFQVRAKDLAQNLDPTPAVWSWTVDTQQPDTAISSGPANPTTATTGSFAFAANESSTFECSLDQAAYLSCASPRSYSGLAVGTHELRVRAIDLAGNLENSPAQYQWTIQAPAPPPPPPPGTPTLQDVDGGLGYYGRFSNGLPTAATYFPIGAWLRPAFDPEHFGDYASFGMNVFVGVENPEMTDEAMIGANGMRALIQAEERTRFNGLGSETAGWLVGDEHDMQFGPGIDTTNCNGPHSSGSGATSGYQTMRQSLASLPNDGRVRYANYGKGVLEWESDAQASCFVNAFQQIVSTDYYWFTDPNARGNPRYGFGSSYGDDVSKVRRLDALDGVRQPVWHFVELGWPATESATAGGRRILPAEIRSAVWHALIAGARGIIYFDHNFGPGTPGSTILEEGYEDNRVAASQVNAQVKALAPVLNGSFVTSGHSATDTMTGTVRYMVKWANAKFYLFAGADRGGGSATFSIPCVGNATAVVEGENRSLPVTSGSFTDQFADKNAIHIYRIDGGSTCGLN